MIIRASSVNFGSVATRLMSLMIILIAITTGGLVNSLLWVSFFDSCSFIYFFIVIYRSHFVFICFKTNVFRVILRVVFFFLFCLSLLNWFVYISSSALYNLKAVFNNFFVFYVFFLIFITRLNSFSFMVE